MPDSALCRAVEAYLGGVPDDDQVRIVRGWVEAHVRRAIAWFANFLVEPTAAVDQMTDDVLGEWEQRGLAATTIAFPVAVGDLKRIVRWRTKDWFARSRPRCSQIYWAVRETLQQCEHFSQSGAWASCPSPHQHADRSAGIPYRRAGWPDDRHAHPAAKDDEITAHAGRFTHNAQFRKDDAVRSPRIFREILGRELAAEFDVLQRCLCINQAFQLSYQGDALANAEMALEASMAFSSGDEREGAGDPGDEDATPEDSGGRASHRRGGR